MQINKYPLLIATLGGIVLTVASCKGRTTENMEPTGETVNVVIDTLSSVERRPVEIELNNPVSSKDKAPEQTVQNSIDAPVTSAVEPQK